MKKLLKYFEGYKKYLFLGPFFKLLEAVFELIVPLVTAKIIDVGIYSGDRDYIIKMSLVIIFLGLAGLAFALTCQYFAAKCAYGFGTKLRTALYKVWAFHATRNGEEIFPEDMKKYANDVWSTLTKSYEYCGGMAGMDSIQQLIDETTMWKLVRKEGKIVACIVYTNKRGGRKACYAGTDGTEKAIWH